MRLDLDWSDPTLADQLRNLDGWQTAAALCHAVQRYAETGEGDVRRVENSRGGFELRLYVARAYARVAFDAKEPILHVAGFYSLRPTLRIVKLHDAAEPNEDE